MKQKKKLMIYNIVGIALFIVGVIALFTIDNKVKAFSGGAIAFLGIVLVGGLPKIENIKKTFKQNLILLATGIIFLGFYISSYGYDAVKQEFMSFLIAFFLVGVIVNIFSKSIIKG